MERLINHIFKVVDIIKLEEISQRTRENYRDIRKILENYEIRKLRSTIIHHILANGDVFERDAERVKIYFLNNLKYN